MRMCVRVHFGSGCHFHKRAALGKVSRSDAHTQATCKESTADADTYDLYAYTRIAHNYCTIG